MSVPRLRLPTIAMHRCIQSIEWTRPGADAARRFSELDHFMGRKTMRWLTEKFQSTTASVVANRLESMPPITMNGRSLRTLNSVASSIYRESFKKDGHPYLIEVAGGEPLPEEDP